MYQAHNGEKEQQLNRQLMGSRASANHLYGSEIFIAVILKLRHTVAGVGSGGEACKGHNG
jgi:hypothetical protein